ncbi:MAG TPA: family 10 glycosylhydrolase, partial [Chthonomonadales bacterium]|nr:family 10 glycosylhydrolase [Chthonomonadales bacterium]
MIALYRRWLGTGAVLLMSACAAWSSPSKNTAPEMRAFWVDGFNPGIKSPQEIDTLLQRLHQAHCNAVFAQVRKGGDAYYASHYEPWAADDPQHFDSLAYLIRQAHSMQPPIAVYAWINTCAVGKGALVPQYHIAQLHPDWLSTNPQNSPDDKEAYKIDPGNPDAADWTFRVYLDVVRHYPVDGIHFDFVRYGGQDWGYNPASVERFYRQCGNRPIRRIAGTNLPDPADPLWMQWRRDQVTDLVRKVYAFAVEINPRIVVSAAVIAWGDGPRTGEEWFTKSAAMNRVFQDWRGWLKEGTLDLACPMTYFQAGRHTTYQTHWAEFIRRNQYSRAATIAVGSWLNTIPENLSLLKIARADGPDGRRPYGVMFYSYASPCATQTAANGAAGAQQAGSPQFFSMLGAPSRYADPPPFPTDAPLPPMSWKLHPKRGHLKGFVLGPDLLPVDGATVEVRSRGRTYRRVTDGTGFYGLIDLPAGMCRISVRASGFAARPARADIAPGRTATHNFLGPGYAQQPPAAESVADARSQALASSPANHPTAALLRNVVVTLGSDTYPGNLYVKDGSGQGIRVRLNQTLPLPFQPGDVVDLIGTAELGENGEPMLSASSARLIDIAADSALPQPRVTTPAELLAAAPDGAGSPFSMSGLV